MFSNNGITTTKLPPLNLFHWDSLPSDDDVIFLGSMNSNPIISPQVSTPDYLHSSNQNEFNFFPGNNYHQDWSSSSCSDSTVSSPAFSITPSPSSVDQTFQFPTGPLSTTEGEEEEEEEEFVVLDCRWVDCKAGPFGSQEELVRHIERSHVDQRRAEDFTCFWAGCPRRHRPFNARYKLLIHMRVHSGEKPNRCTYDGCLKAFSRLENLKIHLRSHTGEKPYLCQYYPTCRKTFSNSSDRAKHQRTHIDTKPYACQVAGCLKRYTDPSSLRKHVKNHVVKQLDAPILTTPVKRPKKRRQNPTIINETFFNHHHQHQEEVMINQDEPSPAECWNFNGTDLVFDQVFAVEDEALLLDETAKLMEDGGLLFNELNRYVQDDNGDGLFFDDMERLCGLPSSSFV